MGGMRGDCVKFPLVFLAILTIEYVVKTSEIWINYDSFKDVFKDVIIELIDMGFSLLVEIMQDVCALRSMPYFAAQLTRLCKSSCNFVCMLCSYVRDNHHQISYIKKV